MSAIGLETVIERGTGHVEAQMGEQNVLMNIAEGKYFALEATGQRIWELTAEPVRIRDIVDALVEEYVIDRGRCETEVMGFLRQLQDSGLMVEKRS